MHIEEQQELQAKWLACFQEYERPARKVIYFRSSSNCDGISEGEASFTFTLKQLYWFIYVQYRLSLLD